MKVVCCSAGFTSSLSAIPAAIHCVDRDGFMKTFIPAHRRVIDDLGVGLLGIGHIYKDDRFVGKFGYEMGAYFSASAIIVGSLSPVSSITIITGRG